MQYTVEFGIARRHHLKTMRGIRSFWSYLKTDSPEQLHIEFLVRGIGFHADRAQTSYRLLAERFTFALEPLRCYVLFLRAVMNDTDAATDVEQTITSIEQSQKERLLSNSAQSLDMLAPKASNGLGGTLPGSAAPSVIALAPRPVSTTKTRAYHAPKQHLHSISSLVRATMSVCACYLVGYTGLFVYQKMVFSAVDTRQGALRR